MKSTFPPIKAKLTLAIGLSSALFLVGCGPAVEDSALVETNDTTTSTNTSTSFLASAKAVVSQREVTATSECSNGGVEIQAGNDTNGNATLDSSEVVRKWVVCHGTDGANGAAGQSTHFEVNPVEAGTTCPAGGQTIKIGLKEGEGFKVGSPTQSFNICNGAEGKGMDLATKIAQGKALVKNTSVHLDNLINEGAYDSYMDSVEAIFSDKNTTGLYGVLGDAVAGALDVMNRSSTDYTAGLKVFLKARGYSDSELVNLTATLTGSQLTVTGLTSKLTGSRLDSLVVEHATRADIEGDSVERFHIQDYKVKNATHQLNPTTASISFVELRLAARSLSWQQMVTALEKGTWDENSYRTNANSKFVLDLSGVQLSTLDGSTSFTGDMDFNVDLYQGELDNRIPAFDFNQAHLAGALLHNSKTFNVDVLATLAPKKNGFMDPTFMTDEQQAEIEIKLIGFKSLLTTLGVPIVFDTFERNGETVERITVDYASVLTLFKATLKSSDDDQFTITGADKIVVEAVNKEGANFEISQVSFRGEKEMDRSIFLSYSTNIHATLASIASASVELKAFIYGFETTVRAYFESPSVPSSSSVLRLSTNQWRYHSGVDEADSPVDIQAITAKIDSNVDGVFDVTLSLKDIKEVSDPRWGPEVTATTSLLLKHNHGELLANLELWQDPESHCSHYTYYADDFNGCLDGSNGGVKRSDMSVAFTDLNGAKFFVQFQDRTRSEDFSAYVTVDGINVGKLVELRNGDYAVEFRDYERVKLINN